EVIKVVCSMSLEEMPQGVKALEQRAFGSRRWLLDRWHIARNVRTPVCLYRLAMTPDSHVKCGHGFALRVAPSGRALRGDGLERCHCHGCDHPGSRTHRNGRVMPNLLATNLRLPPPQRLRQRRRAGPHSIVLSAPARKRNAAARLAREGRFRSFLLGALKR